MRVTIVPDDNYIAIDGVGYNIITTYEENIHAIQWYDNFGTIEYKIGPQERFEDISRIQPYINVYMEQRKINTRQS